MAALGAQGADDESKCARPARFSRGIASFAGAEWAAPTDGSDADGNPARGALELGRNTSLSANDLRLASRTNIVAAERSRDFSQITIDLGGSNSRAAMSAARLNKQNPRRFSGCRKPMMKYGQKTQIQNC